MARKAEGLSRRRIDAAMRVVDAGKSDKEVIRDTTVRGLALAIGKRTQRWVLEYKAPLPGGGWSGGRRLVLGGLADMDVEAAREAALAAKRVAATGVDPALAKRARRAINVESGVTRTLRAACERLIEERESDWTTATRTAYTLDLGLICRTLDADAPLATIERDALVGFIEDHLAEARRKGTAGLRRAVRLADLLGQIWWSAGSGTPSRPGWNWPGIDPRTADRLPVPGRHRITSRTRVLSEAEIRALWPVLRDGVPGSGVGAGLRLLMQLMLVTGLRGGALALCRVSDLDLDPAPVLGARDSGPTIRIPAEDGRKATAKARREGGDIVLPLSGMAVELFEQAIAMRRHPGAFVFEGHAGGHAAGPEFRG
jgi:integrase